MRRLTITLALTLTACSITIQRGAPDDAPSPFESPFELDTPVAAPYPEPTREYPPQERPPGGGWQLAAGPLRAGRYTTTVFEPPFTFRLDEGWRASEPIDGSYPPVELEDFIEIERPGLVLSVLRPRALAVLEDGEVVERLVPPDLVGWLQAYEGWDAAQPTAIDVGGFEGAQFNAVVTSPEGSEAMCGQPCTTVFALSHGGTFLLFDRHRVRVTVLRVGSYDLVYVIDSRPDRFEAGVSEAMRVLRSIEFEPR